jgi:subtilase family serine protease
VALTWNATSGATTYNVYRATTAGGEGTAAFASGITATNYTNTGLSNGTTYYYKVAAVNSVGTSGQSAEVSATPGAGPPDLVVTSVSWSPASPNSGDHVVFSCVVKNQGGSATASGTIVGVQFAVDGVTTPVNWSDTDTTSLAPGASVTLTANNGTNGVNYWTATSGTHSIQAWVDDVNRIAESNENNNKTSASFAVGTGATAPSAPGSLTATAGNTQISLTWSTSTGTAPITYSVFRGTAAGGESTTAIATGLTATSYTNTGLTNGTKYYYTVKAVNSVGTSAASNEASATPAGGVTGIDLIVTSITWTPSPVASGSHVVWTATVKNQGNTATPAGTIVGVQFSVDGNTSVITWNDKDTTSLGAGQSVTLTATGGTNGVNYWLATSGSHTVQAWADDVNRIAESNENNNKLIASFSVP